MAAGAKFGAARGVCPVSSWLLCEPSPRRGPVHPPPFGAQAPGTGPDLLCGSVVEVGGVFQRRLRCLATLI